MRLPTLIPALLASGATTAWARASSARTAVVYIQPITAADAPPSFLAELALPDLPPSPSSSSSSSSSNTEAGDQDAPIPLEILAYEAPDLEDDNDNNDEQQQLLFRTGVYDPAAKRWASPTTVLSARNFAKGYAPHIELLSAGEGEEEGGFLGVTCRGVAIDAGQTRDFGPQAVLVRGAARQGAQPALGKPVVLSPEGRKVVVEEKSFVQKYVAPFLIGCFVRVFYGVLGVVMGIGVVEGIWLVERVADLVVSGGLGTGGRWHWARFCCCLAGAEESRARDRPLRSGLEPLLRSLRASNRLV